jgi:hypothetical protein
MGVPGLIGVLERMFGNDLWVKQQTSLATLAHRAEVTGSKKVIAVDAMNFLFYLAGLKDSRGVEHELKEFCAALVQAGLRGLFIFDSAELSAERKRKAGERKAQRKDAIKRLRNTEQMSAFDRADKARKLEVLRTRTICVTPDEVLAARRFIEGCDWCTLVECSDEADSECAAAVKNGRAGWCLSNDSDMFVEGCASVLRMYDPATGCMDEWNTARILNSLRLNVEQFAEMVKPSEGKRMGHNELFGMLSMAMQE